MAHISETNKAKANSKKTAEKSAGTSRAYAHYVLFVLVLVYIFNFVDRQILSILAQDIKADLGISDAEMGFLYGTVFAVFYAVFGIPLARFADVWVRRSLISAGLLFWSVMTALSGTARSFLSLAAYRTGVGIGEASASPAAYSMLSDYYPQRVRTTVLAIYSSGVYIGGGIGLFLGGWVLETWSTTFPDPATAPFALKGWHIAFMIVGIPGIAMAAWVRTLKEPIRGSSEGLSVAAHPAPFRVLLTELASVIPPFSLIGLVRQGSSWRINGAAGLAITLLAFLLINLTGSTAQWTAIGIGAYITFSWAQSLAIRDPATFAMMFRSKALIFTTLAFPTMGFISYGTSFWTAPFLMRAHDTNPAEVGLYIGLGNALGGLIGVTAGGLMADRLKLTWASGRLLVGFFTIALGAPLILWMLYTPSLTTAFWLNFAYHIPMSMWVGIPPTVAADLVMPRMRAVAGAYYLLMNTFIGLALGPYVIGQLSDSFASAGMSAGDSLRTAIALALGLFAVTLVLLLLAVKYLPGDERSRLQRAKQHGEVVD